MGRYKGVGMPRPKKKKLDAARDRLLTQVDSVDADNVAPQAVLEPLAALPPALEPTAADVLKKELQDARRTAREAGWIAAELSKDVEIAKRNQILKVKVVEAKMSQWLRESKRPVKAKRPDAYVCAAAEVQQNRGDATQCSKASVGS